MELLKKIQNIIESSEIEHPICDISSDLSGNIYGTIYSNTFGTISIEDAQTKIWEILSSKLSVDECIKIRFLITETHPVNENGGSISPFMTTTLYYPTIAGQFFLLLNVNIVEKPLTASSYFFLFYDAEKFFHDSCSFQYSKEVLQFMDLTEKNVIERELYHHVKEQGINTIELYQLEESQKKGYHFNPNDSPIVLKTISENKIRLKYPQTIKELEKINEQNNNMTLRKSLEQIIELNNLIRNQE